MAEPADNPPLPPYIIEGARSSRSRCKTCRRSISKGGLRLGILVEGPYGAGHMWHHLNCAAKRHAEQLEEAYAQEAWNEAKEPPAKIPTLASLRALAQEAETRRRERPSLPYVEMDPSGRARCKQCGERLAKGRLRVVLGRRVEFGSQTRISPIQVHPACVAAALAADDTDTRPDALAEGLRAHSRDVPAEQIEALLAEIGPVA